MKLAVVATAIVAAACASGALGGCGGAAPPAAHPAPSLDGGSEAAISPDGLASIDALATRGASEAPLMREVLRVEHAAPRSPDVRADRDLCVRAIVAASRPVRAWLADQGGTARGEVLSGLSGAVPPRGPACARKGESLHLVVESDGPVAARAVLFAAP